MLGGLKILFVPFFIFDVPFGIKKSVTCSHLPSSNARVQEILSLAPHCAKVVAGGHLCRLCSFFESMQFFHKSWTGLLNVFTAVFLLTDNFQVTLSSSTHDCFDSPIECVHKRLTALTLCCFVCNKLSSTIFCQQTIIGDWFNLLEAMTIARDNESLHDDNQRFATTMPCNEESHLFFLLLVEVGKFPHQGSPALAWQFKLMLKDHTLPAFRFD